MATQLLGTNANNSLTAVVWTGVATPMADVRAINQLIRDDQQARHALAATSAAIDGFVREGVLYVPNRGALTLFPGDIVALDATSGQPILLSGYGRTAGPWTLT